MHMMHVQQLATIFTLRQRKHLPSVWQQKRMWSASAKAWACSRTLTLHVMLHTTRHRCAPVTSCVYRDGDSQLRC